MLAGSASPDVPISRLAGAGEALGGVLARQAGAVAAGALGYYTASERAWIVGLADPPDSQRRAAMADGTNTIRLHRVLKAPAERVYRAFLDPAAMAKWLPPHG